MRAEKITLADGSIYYSFQYYCNKTKKRNRLSRKEIRKRFGKDITTLEEAKDCLKLLEAEHTNEIIRIERKLEWLKQYHDFDSLLDQFEKHQKKKAPRSYKSNIFWFKHYVLAFFLKEKKLNTIDLWPDYFGEFTEWLLTAPKIRDSDPISYTSKNHSIKTLNLFLKLMFNKGIIDRQATCEVFGNHLVKTRTIDDVIMPEEQELVERTLINEGHDLEALYFKLLYFTGLRMSEGLGLSIGDFYQGDLGDGPLKRRLNQYNMKWHGYIVLKSQLDKYVDNQPVKIPLKGRKVISEKHARVVPITDKDLWNRLVDQVIIQEDFKAKKTFGTNAQNYTLFREVNDTTSSRRLQAAFEKNNLKYRSWHCCRHSRATFLIGETGDELLTRMWLGHSSPRTLEKYNHIYQLMVRQATRASSGLKKV